MGKNEHWICPECGSEVKMDKNKCWRCDFTADEVSKYKYDRIAGFISNLKIILFVFTSLAAFSVAVIFFIESADYYYVARQKARRNRIAMELKAQKERMEEMQRQRYERERQASHEIFQRYQAQRDNAQQEISNLESNYYNLLTQCRNVNGAYERLQIRETLEGILHRINNIAYKENLPDKIIYDIEAKVQIDIVRYCGH